MRIRLDPRESFQTLFHLIPHVSSVKTPKGSVRCYDEAIKQKEDIFITTLNGLPRSWDSFIREMCARRKLITFNKLWEECTQEEAQLLIREEKMGETKYQSLMIQRRSLKR